MSKRLCRYRITTLVLFNNDLLRTVQFGMFDMGLQSVLSGSVWVLLGFDLVLPGSGGFARFPLGSHFSTYDFLHVGKFP